MSHELRKLWDTLSICARIICARHFGQYRHSGWNGQNSYARYAWCGHDYYIPTMDRALEP